VRHDEPAQVREQCRRPGRRHHERESKRGRRLDADAAGNTGSEGDGKERGEMRHTPSSARDGAFEIRPESEGMDQKVGKNRGEKKRERVQKMQRGGCLVSSVT
jgi:hypothetical protein